MNLDLLKELSCINSSKIKANEFIEKVNSLLKQEFKENILCIKTLPETEFMKKLGLSFKELYNSFFSAEQLESDQFSISLRKEEKRLYDECYLPTLKEINKALAAYDSKAKMKTVDGRTLLTSFHKHCVGNCVAYHCCKDKGRFINVYVGLSIEYVICAKCLLVYRKEFIPMHCEACKVAFYSAYQTVIEQKCFPVTWMKYHCKGVIPEQMRCVTCNNKLWLSKANLLCCKQCKSLHTPSEIEWKCKACLNPFKIKDSELKEFNQVEAILIKRSIKAAIIFKQPASPMSLPCNCKETNQEMAFHHSKDCSGLLFIGELNGSSIIVCSKCCHYFDTNEFNWICPVCSVEFICSSNSFHIKDDTIITDRRKRNLSINLTHYSILSSTPQKEANASEDNTEGIEGSFTKVIPISTDKSLSIKSFGYVTPQKLFVGNSSIGQGLNESKFTSVTSSFISPNLNHSTVISMSNENRTKKKRDLPEFQVIVPKKAKKAPIAISSYQIKLPSFESGKEDIFDKERRTFIPQSSAKKKETQGESKEDKVKRIETIVIEKYIIGQEIDSLMKAFHVSDELGKQYTLKVVEGSNVAAVEKLLKKLEPIQDGSLVNVIGQNKLNNKLSIILEQVDVTLADAIHSMIESKQYFNQIDLQVMIFNVISSFIFSEKHKISLVDVSPQNLVKTCSGYKLMPELLELFSQEEAKKAEASKGKLSQLAHCVLYASTLSSELAEELMQVSDSTEKLIKLHTSLRQRYKSEFINCIGSLLKDDGNKHLTIKELEKLASFFELN